MPANTQTLEALLEQSAKLHTAIGKHREQLGLHPGNRYLLSAIATVISLEHALGILTLMAGSSFTSTFALFRVQYEALTRGIWLLYGASEEWVEKLSAPLTTDNAKKANEGPMLSKMLGELEGKAPEVVMSQLKEFKEYSWKALSSYIHVGLHPLTRKAEGYPIGLIEQVLRQSNGLSLMGTMLLTMLSGDPRQQGKVAALQREFAGCCPDPQTGHTLPQGSS